MSDREALWRLVDGYKATQALHVAVALGVPDLLAGGPRSSEELAAGTGSHEPSLYRLLRALAALGVLREEDGRRFSLTRRGEPLRSDAPDSLAGWVAFIGRTYHWDAWGDLLNSVRTGENAVERTLGQSVWEYRAQQPEEAAIFDRAMTDLTRGSSEIATAYDFGAFETIVDIGGGHGALLAAILSAVPGARGILFDQPDVVAGATRVLADAGVADRCTVVGGSFFEAVPEGGDAYILKSVIHDWNDRDATRILRTCRAAMAPKARLLVLERDLGAANEAPSAKLSDLNMLVVLGGLERTREEYAALFGQAGFAFVGETPAAAGFAVFEATPA